MKYKIFEHGQFRQFAEEIQPDMLVVGVSGFQPVTVRTHYYAAGWSELVKNMTEEELNSAAHINPPYAEKL